MAGYRANIGGAFGGGAGPAASHPIDIGAAIDAAVGGASTLIQNAYMRKQGAAKLAMEQQQRDTEAQRYAQQNEREVARDAFTQSEAKANRERQSIQDAFAREKFDTETALAKEKNDRDFMEKGGSVGKTTISRQPDATASVPPIAQAFSQGNLSAGAPASSSPLTQAPSLGSVPHLNVTSTQDSLGVPRDRTRTPFMEDGQARLGSMDKQGNLYREDGSPVSGKVTPYVPPEHEQRDHFTFVTTTGPDGKQVVSRANTSTGQIEPTGAEAKATATAGGGGGQGQGVQARLLGAVSEARAASKRMDAYENKMLANPEKATPGLLTQLGGKMATRQAGQHSLSGIVGETVGEAVTDPEYLQYVRDAGLMARATQMMSSRGGSEAMVSAEQLLNRAVPNAAGLKGSVDAARKSRNAIFGPMGGLMQAMTPEQIAKINAGLDALEKGDGNHPAVREAATIIEGARHAPPAPAGGLSHLTDAQLWDAAKAKHGEAHTLKELGPRPHD